MLFRSPSSCLSRPHGQALLLSIGIALVSTEGGILLSLAKPWPTSFFISAISFAFYVSARLKSLLARS